jgi:GTP-binding protein Era
LSTSSGHRAGVVALLGRPNAGKSTLLNRLLGEKLAIVTRKPQTTRSRILGILNTDGAQLLLLDTPGFHPSGKALNKALNEIVDRVAEDCDAAVLLVDPGPGWDEQYDAIFERLGRRGAKVIIVATKQDLARGRAHGIEGALEISAETGEGVDALIERMVEALPESPPFFGPDEITDRSMRFLAAELVRESVFEELGQELPYSTAVEILAFDETRPEMIRIQANLIVERKSQKGMVVGKNGQMIKQIGQRSRAAIEEMLGTRVHLELWVKVEPKWTKRPNRLKALGYD